MMAAGAKSGLPPPPPLAQIRGAALFLDLDGTLVPFAAHPGAVVPDPERTALLTRLGHGLAGRLAVVSGRSISDIDRILEGSVPAVAGIHGLERRSSKGVRTAAAAHPALAAARASLSKFAAGEPGVVLEDKAISLALHFRGAPSAEDSIRALTQNIAKSTGLIVQNGAMVAELRTPGPDKGDAIRAFMEEEPFAGAMPVFIGDDLTDEHGFALVEELGGLAILAGAQRETRAAMRLADVNAVLEWLKGSTS